MIASELRVSVCNAEACVICRVIYRPNLLVAKKLELRLGVVSESFYFLLYNGFHVFHYAWNKDRTHVTWSVCLKLERLSYADTYTLPTPQIAPQVISYKNSIGEFL